MGGVSLLKYHQNLSKMMDFGGQITRNLIQIDGILELMVDYFFTNKSPTADIFPIFSSVFLKGTNSNSTRLQFRCQQSRALASAAINRPFGDGIKLPPIYGDVGAGL